jgi:hypothetical protein
MGQALTTRLTGLSATNARLVVSTAATAVVLAVAGVLAAAGSADGEVVATILFLPVFLAALYAGRAVGFVAAVLALGIYVAVRRDDLEAAATTSAVVLAATRGIAYAVAAHLGARARALIGGGKAAPSRAAAGAGRRPSERAAGAARPQPVPQWTEPAYATGPDRGAPVLTGVGARSHGDSWPGEPAAPITMSNAAWPPPPGPPSGGEEAAGAAAPGRSDPWAAEDGSGDDSWAAVQQSWRRQHGLPPDDAADDPGGWPGAPAPAARDDDETGRWPGAPAAAAQDDDTGRRSLPASAPGQAPGWPAPAPGGPGWGAPPPAPDSWQPPSNGATGRIPASDPWADLAGDAWPAGAPAPENGRTGADEEHWSTRRGEDHGPATGETWAAVFTDPTTGRGPTTGEHNWGPDPWPPTPAASPDDDWPQQLAPSPEDTWPPTPATSPRDSWPHEPAASPQSPWPPTPDASPQDSWPPTPAASGQDSWPHQPAASPQDSWPPTPAASPPSPWPPTPAASPQDSWPPTPAASPDGWPHQASPRDSWPPTPAASPDATWASLAPPAADSWPPPPAAPVPDGGWSPAAGGRPGTPAPPAPAAPTPPWAAAVPEAAPSLGGNGWAPPAAPGHAPEEPPPPLPAVDPETGLWTARFLRDRLSAERSRSRRSRHPFSLVLVQVPDAPLAALPYRRQLTLLRELGYQFVAGGVVDHLVHVPDQEQHWFAVILPDTDRSGAQVLERRLRLGIGGYLSSRGLRLTELQSASLTAPDDDPAMAAIWDALIGPEDADDPAAVVPEY